MRLCLKCHIKRYGKGTVYCPICKNKMIPVDDPLRKAVEALHKADFDITFAACTACDLGISSSIELSIGFLKPYDKILFQDLPKDFFYETADDGVLFQYGAFTAQSMLTLEYYGAFNEIVPIRSILRGVVDELYLWASNIMKTGAWAVCKLGGTL